MKASFLNIPSLIGTLLLPYLAAVYLPRLVHKYRLNLDSGTQKTVRGVLAAYIIIQLTYLVIELIQLTVYLIVGFIEHQL